MQLSAAQRRQIIGFQQTEITEYHIYKRLAKRINSPENARILEKIAVFNYYISVAKGESFRARFFGNGRVESRRDRIFLCDRLFHPPVAGDRGITHVPRCCGS